MPAEHFEFAAIGGGKGGKTLAAKMATAGHRVVMIAAAVIWLCSDAAAFMIGHALVIDGGQTIQ